MRENNSTNWDCWGYERNVTKKPYGTKILYASLAAEHPTCSRCTPCCLNIRFISMIAKEVDYMFNISEHTRTCVRTYVHTYMFVVNFDALAQESDFRNERRRVVSLNWIRDSNQGLWNRISSRLNARWETDWAIGDQAKHLNSIALNYDQRAFSPLDPSASWLLHLPWAIYRFVVVSFDALTQASDFRIEIRRVVFLCWIQDSNQGL